MIKKGDTLHVYDHSLREHVVVKATRDQVEGYNLVTIDGSFTDDLGYTSMMLNTGVDDFYVGKESEEEDVMIKRGDEISLFDHDLGVYLDVTAIEDQSKRAELVSIDTFFTDVFGNRTRILDVDIDDYSIIETEEINKEEVVATTEEDEEVVSEFIEITFKEANVDGTYLMSFISVDSALVDVSNGILSVLCEDEEYYLKLEDIKIIKSKGVELVYA